MLRSMDDAGDPTLLVRMRAALRVERHASALEAIRSVVTGSSAGWPVGR
jgi:hypothetical protein